MIVQVEFFVDFDFFDFNFGFFCVSYVEILEVEIGEGYLMVVSIVM